VLITRGKIIVRAENSPAFAPTLNGLGQIDVRRNQTNMAMTLQYTECRARHE
jgi:hypothetical protein